MTRQAASGSDPRHAVHISLASPEKIRSWSHGEVKGPATIDRDTLRPERGGLFCERIFGPIRDFRCSCGKYVGREHRGITCDLCGVEVTHSRVRRQRMGHIELACPVAHTWWVNAGRSRLALLLGTSRSQLKSVIRHEGFVITEGDEEARQRALKRLRRERKEEMAAVQQRSPPREVAKNLQAVSDRFDEEVSQLRRLKDRVLRGQLTLLSETEYRALLEKYTGVFQAETGAAALLKILARLDLNALHSCLTDQLGGRQHKTALKRLRVVEALRNSGNKPEWMILTVLPVLPPDLRPMVQLNDGRFATSDLNHLYRRVNSPIGPREADGRGARDYRQMKQGAARGRIEEIAEPIRVRRVNQGRLLGSRAPLSTRRKSYKTNG
jgi:DNA-directed RNA polymerase subunit beta'